MSISPLSAAGMTSEARSNQSDAIPSAGNAPPTAPVSYIPARFTFRNCDLDRAGRALTRVKRVAGENIRSQRFEIALVSIILMGMTLFKAGNFFSLLKERVKKQKRKPSQSCPSSQPEGHAFSLNIKGKEKAQQKETSCGQL